MSRIDKLYHKKQQEVLQFALNNDYFMLINHGAKRTGKTILNNDLFLMELRRVKKLANEDGIKEPQYILAGADLGAIQRNVLNELSNKYGLEFKFDKHNRFKLFGVLVCCFGHSKINDLNRIRGMTSHGAYINEATLSNKMVFDEIKSRCSGRGARILIDTNPDSPEHWLKKDYIDKADKEVIAEFRYILDDNTFLSERYRKNIKKSTPSGMFTDRNIYGLWVSAEGLVYQDFNKDKHYVHELPKDLSHFYCGVDWGYEHYGSIVVIGENKKGIKYLVKEYTYKHKEIDDWVNIAKNIKSKYGNINFYCDSARPEYLIKFKKEGLRAFNGSKRVKSGIERVAKELKRGRIFVYYEGVNHFRDEIYKYAWNEKTGEPIKENDDVMDAFRYAIVSEYVVKNKQY